MSAVSGICDALATWPSGLSMGVTVAVAADPVTLRESAVMYLRSQFVGPAGGDSEVLDSPPDRRYLMGTLYPPELLLRPVVLADGEIEDDRTDSDGDPEEGRFSEDPVTDANTWLPSSLGFTFFTDADSLSVRCSAAHYVTHGTAGARIWRREPLGPEELPLPEERVTVFGGRAEVRVRRRPYPDGQLITVSLVNTYLSRNNSQDRDNMLFQAALEVRVKGAGRIKEYPSVRLASQDEEEQELRLQYRHAKTFAVGHGCATRTLQDPSSGAIVGVASEVMPHELVQSIGAAGPTDLSVLSLAWLSDTDLTPPRLGDALSDFVRQYRDWYEDQLSEAAGFTGWMKAPAERILSRIERALTRMESGATTLANTRDPLVFEAFLLANRAMALQMRHSQDDLGGLRRTCGAPFPRVAEPDSSGFVWRPFQLAYFLLVVNGLVDASHPDREIVDLIWFPTGGGKTEAYLFVAAFEIILRRLRHGSEGGGTAVISRYTLSLLTAQQFQRAAGVICALEYLRRGLDTKYQPALGGEPISIGLWTGEGTTPNRYAKAEEALSELLAMSEPDDRFLLERCPWCGTEVLPRKNSNDRNRYGIHATATSFHFHCTSNDCAFDKVLPIQVVDDHLYDSPPTFVLGTVDKFARLAWEPRAGALFGSGGHLRPSLIIQDELHLLSGPLGTTVGIYESAVLQLCAWNGSPPKVIASTATIRRASDQVRSLYGRDVCLFPPAGLNASHSYFSQPDPSQPGRVYVGVMAQGHSNSTAVVHVGAAMAQVPAEVAESPLEKDLYWTLVAYHNSIRELGKTVTLARDDIAARLRYLGATSGRVRPWSEEIVKELTSHLSRAEQPRLLERLETAHPAPDAISFLATTNMLSVGIDIPRLALMLVMGQPKTTAEYIQATSRVGRGKGRPGLIVTMLRPTKPRDRSHYETFGTYHQSLYRNVEPTSVTPWSLASRRRALHACIVILARHGIGLALDADAGSVLRCREELEMLRKRIVDHAAAADPHERRMVQGEVDQLLSDWLEWAKTAEQSGKKLRYSFQGRAQPNLLKQFGAPHGYWETLNSMRNVDDESLIQIRGEQ